MVLLNTVEGQTDHLHIALSELWTHGSCSAQLGGADRRVVPRVREQDAPASQGKISKSFTDINFNPDRKQKVSEIFLLSNECLCKFYS